MKTIIIIMLVTVFSGCKESPKLEVGMVDTALERGTLTDDSRIVGQSLPPEATNRVYLGNGWFTFELAGHQYLFADRGRASTLAQIR